MEALKVEKINEFIGNYTKEIQEKGYKDVFTNVREYPVLYMMAAIGLVTNTRYKYTIEGDKLFQVVTSEGEEISRADATHEIGSIGLMTCLTMLDSYLELHLEGGKYASGKFN